MKFLQKDLKQDFCIYLSMTLIEIVYTLTFKAMQANDSD